MRFSPMSPDSSTVLVRGAGGFLGGYFAERLAGKVGVLRLFVRHAERLPVDLRARRGVEVIEADVRDADAVHDSLESVDLVFDFVGGTVPATPAGGLRLELELNLEPLALLLEAMVRVGSSRLVFPSSGGTVYGRTPPEPVSEEAPLRPESPYGVGKVLAEEMIRFHERRDGLRCLVLRLANPYGKIEAATASQGVIDVFLQHLHAGLPVEVWGPGEQVRDYIHIDDACSAIEAILDRGIESGTFNIGTGRGYTLLQVMETIEEVTGRRLEWSRRGDVYSGIPYNVLNVDRIRRVTGWSARYDLREGIRRTWHRVLDAYGEPTTIERSTQ